MQYKLLIFSLLVYLSVNTCFSQVEPWKDTTLNEEDIFFYNLQDSLNTNSKNEEELLAAQYFAEKQYDKAAVLYKNIYQNNPSNSNYNNYLSCLIALKDFSEAEKVVKKSIKLYPYNQKYLVDLGFLYSKEGNNKKASKQYEESIKNLPTNENKTIELANAFLLRGEIDYALETYEKGRKNLKEPYLFTFELADIYEAKKDYYNMMKEYVEYLEYPIAPFSQIQDAIQDKLEFDSDNRKHAKLKGLLYAKVQKDPDKTIFSELLLWLSIQQKDFEMAFIQSKALDKRFDEGGKRLMDLAFIAIENSDYNTGIDCFEYILSLGKNNFLYTRAKAGLLNASFLKITNTIGYTKADLVKIEKEYTSAINEFGKSNATVPMLIDLAHLKAFYLYKTDEAILLLKEVLGMPQIPPKTKADCKIALADILLMSGEPWEATLLYSQVEKAFKHEPIGHYAKFRNAKLSYYIGEFDWAKAQLDVLKAATSKLIANDAMNLSLLIKDNIGTDSSTIPLKKYATADLLYYQNKEAEALQMLDSIEILHDSHPILDNVLFKKAEIHINQENYQTADSLLNKIVENYKWDIVADDALFLRAKIQDEQLENVEKAMELYKTILTEFPGSIYTIKSRKRYRELRGDFIN